MEAKKEKREHAVEAFHAACKASNEAYLMYQSHKSNWHEQRQRIKQFMDSPAFHNVKTIGDAEQVSQLYLQLAKMEEDRYNSYLLMIDTFQEHRRLYVEAMQLGEEFTKVGREYASLVERAKH